MYLTSDPESDNYFIRVIGTDDFNIRLDGIDLWNVRQCDTDPDWTGEGWVERYKRLPNGRLSVDLKMGEVRYELLHGKVEVVPNTPNQIERLPRLPDYYLNGVKLGYETHVLLTADYDFLMRRQRNKSFNPWLSPDYNPR